MTTVSLPHAMRRRGIIMSNVHVTPCVCGGCNESTVVIGFTCRENTHQHGKVFLLNTNSGTSRLTKWYINRSLYKTTVKH